MSRSLLRQRIFDQALDRTTQRTGTERGVVPLLGKVVLGGVAELETHTLAGQLAGCASDHQIDDLANFGLAQLVEDDGVVDAVEELGPEVGLERIVDLLLHLLVAHRLVALGEAEVGLAEILGSEV